ncbi:MAG: hypothetical protein J0H49_11495 [Acidobacteria bacterium]|nr:hypothetical protein [Acidobacteriota bacterium]
MGILRRAVGSGGGDAGMVVEPGGALLTELVEEFCGDTSDYAAFEAVIEVKLDREC